MFRSESEVAKSKPETFQNGAEDLIGVFAQHLLNVNIATGHIIACSSATLLSNKCFNKNACLKNTALFHAQGCNTGIDLQQQVKPSQAPSLHAENDPCRGINFDELVKHAKSPTFPSSLRNSCHAPSKQQKAISHE